jgi:hypothetical protein
MSSQYDNTNRGVLFRNDRKETDNHPDYKGSVNVGGEEFWLSAWINEGKPGSKMEGQKYMSLSVQPKTYETGAQGAPRGAGNANAQVHAENASEGRSGGSSDGSFDDDIPF